MRTAAEVASHPMAHLQRELVKLLRAGGSTEGAALVWQRMQSDARFWRRVTTFGFDDPERQAQITKVAFPDCNFAEVEAALAAGNRLRQIEEIARGIASLARDATGQYKPGRRGLVLVTQARM